MDAKYAPATVCPPCFFAAQELNAFQGIIPEGTPELCAHHRRALKLMYLDIPYGIYEEVAALRRWHEAFARHVKRVEFRAKLREKGGDL